MLPSKPNENIDPQAIKILTNQLFELENYMKTSWLCKI
jgi:hypothetical protein